MTDLIFHLGFTKTGSSFLQRKVFGGKVKTLSRAGDREEDSKLAFELQRFFLDEPVDFWASDKAKAFFDNHVVPEHGAVILSHESLFKHIPYVDSEADLALEPGALAKKLQAIGEHCWPHGKVKVMFFFRKQDDWLASMYSHVTYALKNASQKDFEARVEQIVAEESRTGHVLEYDKIYNELTAVLGSGNVLAIPYEKFSHGSVWKKIEDFSGLEGLYERIPFDDKTVNTKRDNNTGAWSPSGKRLRVAGVNLNAWIKYFLKIILGEKQSEKIIAILRPGWKLTLSGEMRKAILDHYQDSNMRMSENCGFDLSKENYY